MSIDLRDRIAEFLTREIPISRAMQISVDDWAGSELVLSAPLAVNHNDKSTAFGGSMYSLAVLGGWSLVKLRLWQAGRDDEVMVRDAEVRYVAPVAGRLVAHCRLANESDWGSIVEQLEERGKARVQVTATMDGEDGPAMRMQAGYAVLAR